MSQWNLDDFVSFYVEGVATLSVCCVGLVINAAAIVMLLRQKNSGSIFLKLMISLATYDLIYVILSSLCYSLPRLSNDFKARIFVYFVPFLMPVTQMSLAGSTFTTVALTVERYISVCTPFFRQRYNPKAWMFLLPVALFVILYSVPRFFELETKFENKSCPTSEPLLSSDILQNLTVDGVTSPYDVDLITSTVVGLFDVNTTAASAALPINKTCELVTEPLLRVTNLRFNPYYVSIYANWMNLIVNIVLPLAVLVSMNIKIYRTMKGQFWLKAKRDQDTSGGDGRKYVGGNVDPGASVSSVGGLRNSVERAHFRSSFPASMSSSSSRRGQTVNPPNSVSGKWNRTKSNDLGLKNGNSKTMSTGSTSSAAAAANSLRRVAGINEHELKKRDAKYTRASVVMVIVFVVCNTPRFVPNVMELFIIQEQFPKWAFLLISINHLLTVLNSSFNFLIYLSFCGRRKKKRRRLQRRIRRHKLFSICLGNDEDSSTRGSPSGMELTVGTTINRLDQTITEEMTHLTSTSSSSTANAAVAARRAARQAAFRTSKASSGVSFDIPPPSMMSIDEPSTSLIPPQMSIRSRNSHQTSNSSMNSSPLLGRHQVQHEVQMEEVSQ